MMYGLKLEELRGELNKKQFELAELINVDRSAYGQYEREYVIMPIKHLNTICNYFNVSIDYIFDFTNVKQYKNSSKNINVEKSKHRLKQIRLESKKTQTAFGKQFDCSYGKISGFERGRYLISTSTLYDICKKYSISADYLLGKTDTPKTYKS